MLKDKLTNFNRAENLGDLAEEEREVSFKEENEAEKIEGNLETKELKVENIE